MTDARRGLALVGYRGSGKTTVGRIVAARLGWPFADADQELEARAGRSIYAIFEESGEPAFRDLEESTLRDLTARHPLVLATGGGAILRECNRLALREFGTVAWLRADPSTLTDRLGRASGNRPALTPAGLLGEIAEVLEARAPLYRDVADLVVETAGRPPAAIASEILAALELAGN